MTLWTSQISLDSCLGVSVWLGRSCLQNLCGRYISRVSSVDSVQLWLMHAGRSRRSPCWQQLHRKVHICDGFVWPIGPHLADCCLNSLPEHQSGFNTTHAPHSQPCYSHALLVTQERHRCSRYASPCVIPQLVAFCVHPAECLLAQREVPLATTATRAHTYDVTGFHM